MVAHAAAVLALDAGGVPDVVDVAVRKEQRFHRVATRGEPSGGVLRGVDEDAVVAEKEAVRVKDAAGESVEIHGVGRHWSVCGRRRQAAAFRYPPREAEIKPISKLRKTFSKKD